MEASNISLPSSRPHNSNGINDNHIPKPPARHFRTIKRLYISSNSATATYICLPRILPTQYDDFAFIDSDFSSTFTTELSSFGKLQNKRIQHQLLLLQQPSPSQSLLQTLALINPSSLSERHQSLLPHLMIVKTSLRPSQLRTETEILDSLHRGREYTSLHISPSPLSSQISTSPMSSWLATPPVFGPTLIDLCRRAKHQGGLPSYIIAHIFLCLLDAVEMIHADGWTHGGIRVENVRCNMYPRYFHYRYRGWPDVLLENLTCAQPASDAGVQGDVRGVLMVVREVIRVGSDVVSLLEFEAAGKGLVTDDEVVFLLREVEGVLNGEESTKLEIEDVRRRFGVRLEEMRNEGPLELETDMVKMMHDDLVTDEELEDARCAATVLHLGGKREELKRLKDNRRATTGAGGFAGMRTNRIMVMRFERRKKELLKAIGKKYGDHEPMKEMQEAAEGGYM